MKIEFDRLVSPLIGLSGHFVRQGFHPSLFLWEPGCQFIRARPNPLSGNTITLWLGSHYLQVWF
jgi:hypothetical protein